MTSVGISKIRKDAVEKATGKSKFVGDYIIPNMAYGFTLRSPKPHIKIKKIDYSKALKLKGVIKIITSKDVPGKNEIPLVFKDYPVFADKICKFEGQPIALIVAETPEIAQKAAKLINIEYIELPAVFDPLEAMKKTSPKIYNSNNIFKHFKIEKGNIKQGFKSSDLIIEDIFQTNYQVHTYLETNGALAEPQPDGSMTVYGSMQCPFYVLDAVSYVLGMNKSKVTIIQTTTGGAFGGKEDVPSIISSHAAVAAFVIKRPVKIIYSREEDFIGMSKRHPGRAKIKYGVRKDGKILAAEIKYIIDGGAFSTLSPIVLWRGTVHAAGPYIIPNVKINTYAVATNKIPCGAYRGFGQPQINFAQESLIDMIASKLKISPLKIREINGLTKGKLTATGHKLQEEGIKNVLKKAVEKSNYKNKLKKFGTGKGKIKKGIGLSVTYYGVGLGAAGKHLSRTGAFVQVESDGSIRIAFGNTEMGQGAKTVLSQITAETLNAPYEVIQVEETNTSRVPDSGPTVASRTTFMSGNALMNACHPIMLNLKKAAAELLNCSIKDVKAENTKFYYNKKSVTYLKTVEYAHQKKLQMSFQGWYVAPEPTFDKNGLGTAYYSYTFSANVVELHVNIETGEYKIDKIWAAHDIGKAINPQLSEGQIQGGALQGMGYAVMENLVIQNGHMVNPNFTGYIIPTAKDIPDLIPIIVENKDKNGPYGARGLGEPPLIGIAPAVANAIYNATGIRLKNTPMLAENLLEALNQKR